MLIDSRQIIMKLRFGSICSGIEAASTAWEPLGWEPVFFAEIEKHPSAVLRYHWPDVPNLGDFTTIDGKAWDIDVLVGGTPCQAFSVAGRRQSLDDDRGNLTLKFVELVHETDVPVVVWENVPGVLNTSDNAFGCFLGGLVGTDRALIPLKDGGWPGYGMVAGPRRIVAWRILDAQYFGVAQRRRRLFLVSFRAGDGRNPGAVLFEPESVPRDTPPSRETGEEVARCLRARAQSSHREDGDTYIPCGFRMKAFGDDAEDGSASTVKARDHKDATDLIAFNSVDYGNDATLNHTPPLRSCNSVNANQNGRGQGLAIAFDTTQITSKENGSNPKPGDPCHPIASGGHPPAIAWSIMPQNSGKDYKARQVEVLQPLMGAGPVGGNQGGDLIQSNMQVRRLTPVECERLQGFPDNHTQYAVDENGKQYTMPNGARYKALGNSMAVPCMAWIGRRIEMVLEATDFSKYSDKKEQL